MFQCYGHKRHPLPDADQHMLVPEYLKKHVDLRSFNRDGLKAVKKCVGYVIAYIDGGYFLNLSTVHISSTEPNSDLFHHNRFRKIATTALNEVTTPFCELLRVLGPKDIQRP